MKDDPHKRAIESAARLAPKATRGQLKLLEELFSELGFNREGRKDYIRRETKRDITFLDDLAVDEASEIISNLLEQSKRGRPTKKEEDDDTYLR